MPADDVGFRMHVQKIICLSLFLILVVISSVQAVPVFSWTGAIDLVGSKAAGLLLVSGDTIIPAFVSG